MTKPVSELEFESESNTARTLESGRLVVTSVDQVATTTSGEYRVLEESVNGRAQSRRLIEPDALHFLIERIQGRIG